MVTKPTELSNWLILTIQPLLVWKSHARREGGRGRNLNYPPPPPPHSTPSVCYRTLSILSIEPERKHKTTAAQTEELQVHYSCCVMASGICVLVGGRKQVQNEQESSMTDSLVTSFHTHTYITCMCTHIHTHACAHTHTCAYTWSFYISTTDNSIQDVSDNPDSLLFIEGA